MHHPCIVLAYSGLEAALTGSWLLVKESLWTAFVCMQSTVVIHLCNNFAGKTRAANGPDRTMGVGWELHHRPVAVQA